VGSGGRWGCGTHWGIDRPSGTEPGNPGEQFRPDGHYLRNACFCVLGPSERRPHPPTPRRPNRRAYKLRQQPVANRVQGFIVTDYFDQRMAGTFPLHGWALVRAYRDFVILALRVFWRELT
jgi:hypothetical protein